MSYNKYSMNKIVVDFQVNTGNSIRYDESKKVIETCRYSDFNKPLYDEIKRLDNENKELREYIANIIKQINEKLKLYDEAIKLSVKE